MNELRTPAVTFACLLAAATLTPRGGEALVVDQQQQVIEATAGPLAIGGPSEQVLAQIVTVGAAGPLAAVRLPVMCGSGDLVVEIRGVTAGLPNATVMTSQTVAGGDLPPFFPDPPTFREIPFSVPASFAAGDQLAIVLRSAGVCSIAAGPAYDAYAGGSAYFDARPNTPGVWVSLAIGPAAGDDLPFETLVRVQRTVGIDIRPGSPRNTVRPGSGGLIAVAVLSQAGFDATTVDPATVAFGPGGAAPSGSPSVRDVDRDGSDDLVLAFGVAESGIVCGDASASLTGMTTAGVEIMASDAVTTVGCRP